jgi:hypothetical protein
MLRLIHAQTVAGAILVDDIDDGLPNKEVHRLGSTADPKAYVRDGYANKPKQSCYIPRTKALTGFAGIAGYIDLNQSEKVTFSAGKGKIQKLTTAGLISVVSFTAAQVATPVVTAAATVAANFRVTGTTLSSVSPDTTTVTFAQAAGVSAPNPAVWTQAAILLAGGTITATQIEIPTASFVQAPVAANTVKVQANEKNSNTFVST